MGRKKEKNSSIKHSDKKERFSEKTRIPEEVSIHRVFKLFSNNPDKVFTYRQISRRLGVADKAGRELIFDCLKSLKKEGSIRMLENGNYIFNFITKEITGTVELATVKYAYILSDEMEEDVRVYTDKLKFAMDGDVVRVRIIPSKGDRPEGEVVQVLERKREDIVGKIELSKNFGFVVPDYKRIYFDVFVPEKDLNGAQNGDKVLVKVTEWPKSAERNPVGEVSRVFGKAGENEAEIHSIMAEFGLPFEFPEEVEDEAEEISLTISKEEIESRWDFRNVTTFTIDPVDAKDFDDALSVQKLENGLWQIGVHIADVTHYVKPGSKLEEEAFHRATSVYLVDRTIPMLPEKLSNGVCSLRPNEEKLTFSVVFEMDENAEIHNYWIGKTVIHSDRRFTYQEAQDVIEAGEGEYVDELVLLNTLAKKVRDKRFKSGAINFETVEVKFVLDEKGKPVSLYVKERKDAHKLIEEFMLLANKTVAEFVYKKKKGKEHYTMVYRTHDTPDPEKLYNFALFAKKFGYSLDVEKNISRELNTLTFEIEGKPEQNVLQSLAIRTMAKAKYTTEEMGHFGLAFKHYSHFTSPIRRYPDMMAHRLIHTYLNGGHSADKEEFEERCIHSSVMEKRAADAERASIKYKQVEYMQDTIGQTFKGIVSGVTEWGIYVEIEETKCEGMVRLADLDDDFYELDEKNFRIIGRRNKKIISFGQEVMVEVKSVNLYDRTIDLLLIND